MKFNRIFSREGDSEFGDISFTKRNSEIRNPDGELIFSLTNVWVPESWSQMSVDILVQKYFRKAGVPQRVSKVREEGIPVWLQRSQTDPVALSALPESDRFGSETDARQVFRRLAGCWTYWGWQHNYFDSESDARVFYEELLLMLARQMAAPNSPQWFNTGLNWAYGITGQAQGHYYVDPVSGEIEASKDAFSHPQPHACFIQGIDDSLVGDGGIMDLWRREARLFKYGSGTGTNFTAIRGEGEALSGGGKSSGLMSFLRIGDRAAGAIKSGGTTRRAAKMVCLDIDHPDVEQFIDWKMVEEQKVAALVTGSKVCKQALKEILQTCWTKEGELLCDPLKNGALRAAIQRAEQQFVPRSYVNRVVQLAQQGFRDMKFEEYDLDWQSEAYATVSGQNSNNSVRVSNSFMQRVAGNEPWSLRWRTTGKVAKQTPARELWEKIALAAWQCADPGLQFDTTINEWHTCPLDGRINASNPCSEYMFLDDTACNLASINLMTLLDMESGQFDIPRFQDMCRLWTVVLEISVLMAQFPSREIALKSYQYRTLGLGYANLGAAMMVCGIPYHSNRARAIAGSLTAIMTGTCYRTSAEMASELGPFPRYAGNGQSMLRVIRNHRRAAYHVDAAEYESLEVKPKAIDSGHCPAYLLEAARTVWDEALVLGEENGFRNAQVTVIAPTGTIGLVMGCDTTGIEPDFSLVKFKKLAGGGYFKIINHSVPLALRKLGYDERQIKGIVDYCVGTGTLESAPCINHDTLAAKGFSPEILGKLESSLASAFDIRFSFNRYLLGDDFLLNVLKIEENELARWNFDLLDHLGFTVEEIELANRYCCGTMTIEGAPELSEEHYPVFDCANKCGATGQRFIPYEGHLLMMAAAQPFLSGAISKTINMPNDASVTDVKNAYNQAWELGIKAIALYRDGSKLSQAVTTTYDFSNSSTEKEEGSTEVRAAGKLVNHLRTRRVQLPDRRAGYTQKVVIGGHKLYLRTGEYPDGSLGEIFLDMHREGAAFRSLMNCFAIAVSLGLQYGVPLEEYLDAFVFTKFQPAGPVQGHAHIKFSESVIDFIFRELGLSYLDRREYAHVPVIDDPASEDATDREFSKVVRQTEIELHQSKPKATDSLARLKGYEGDPCVECGNLTLTRNGTCLKCDTCGATTGCS